jgi:SPP1 gp7 family putative phage head morphogenesis protein
MATEPTAGNVPFEEAIAFLRDKLRLTSRGWTDVWQEQNAVAFTVAGATSAELVADFHQVVTRAIRDGMTLAEFREDFDAVVERFGWSYRGSRGWRSRVIFETNLRTAYQAGRWDQAWSLREDRPFLRYVAVLDDRTRPAHRAWHGTVLPIGDAWWRTHYPPNGWGCRCTVQSLSARDLARRGWEVTSPAPRSPMVTRSVETPDGPRREEVPEGIDPGWAYNVGTASAQARVAQQAYRDIGKMPADLGAEVGEAIAAATRRAMAEGYRGWVAERQADAFQPNGSWHPLGALSPTTIAKLAEAGQAPQTAGVAITADKLARLVRDAKVAAGKALDMADILRLPEVVDRPDAVLRERGSGTILLVFSPSAPSGGREAKLIVHLDFKGRLPDRDGGRPLRVFNLLKSGGLVDAATLRDRATYELLEGEL